MLLSPVLCTVGAKVAVAARGGCRGCVSPHLRDHQGRSDPTRHLSISCRYRRPRWSPRTSISCRFPPRRARHLRPQLCGTGRRSHCPTPGHVREYLGHRSTCCPLSCTQWAIHQCSWYSGGCRWIRVVRSCVPARRSLPGHQRRHRLHHRLLLLLRLRWSPGLRVETCDSSRRFHVWQSEAEGCTVTGQSHCKVNDSSLSLVVRVFVFFG